MKKGCERTDARLRRGGAPCRVGRPARHGRVALRTRCLPRGRPSLLPGLVGAERSTHSAQANANPERKQNKRERFYCFAARCPGRTLGAYNMVRIVGTRSISRRTRRTRRIARRTLCAVSALPQRKRRKRSAGPLLKKKTAAEINEVDSHSIFRCTHDSRFPRDSPVITTKKIIKEFRATVTVFEWFVVSMPPDSDEFQLVIR